VPDPMLRYGISLILDEHGTALRGTAAVYAADLKLQDIDVTADVIDQPGTSAVGFALDRCGEWLASAAGQRTPDPPSPPSTASTEPLRRRPRGASVRVDPPTPLGVEGVVDPPRSDRRDDPVSRRVDAPVRPGLKSAGQVRPRRRKAVD
jgi:hypothetical protein